MKTRLGLHLAATFIFAVSAAAQTLDVVHRFQSGGGAYGRLIQALDGDFYGTTSWGGTNGVGTIFKMDGAGTLTILHSFGYADGAFPKAALLQAADGNFYGTASEGGSSNVGTIFKMDSGGNVTVLHSFVDTDGANPWAPLIQTADGTFYGTTFRGGAGSDLFRRYGTVFKMDAAGNVTTLHNFGGEDGIYPYAALLQSADGNFYGTTSGGYNYYGDCTDCGTVFKMDASGNVTTIHPFSKAAGGNPHAAVVQDADGNLYGTTTTHRRFVNYPPHYVTVYGTVFKIDPSGVFSVRHAFNANDGATSPGGLIQASDGNLYGTTYGGKGSIFQVTSSGFTTLHGFTGPEGSNPYAGLLQASDGSFYGLTASGGTGLIGTVFKMDASNSLTALYDFTSTEGISPHASLIQLPDGAFYGTTWGGGAGGYGTVFKTDSSGVLTTIHSFDNSDGARPAAALIHGADGDLYGTTAGDGTTTLGTVFKISSAGAFTSLHGFNQTDGASPSAALIQLTDGAFYGTTRAGGVSGFGTVFKWASSGTLTTLHAFDNTDGAYPVAALILGADGNLYGTTAGDGSTTWGTVFKISSGGTFALLHSFNKTDGAAPEAALVQTADGSLYGTTSTGDAGNGFGTVFKVDAGGNVTTLHSFAGADGVGPVGALIQAPDGNLYGTTTYGGVGVGGSAGTVFKIDSSGNLTTLASLQYADGAVVLAGLVRAADGSFWGTTSGGGLESYGGVVFRLIPGASSFEVSSIAPTSGPSTGGLTLSIAGAGFEAGARVMIGSSPANAVSIESSSAVSVLAPSFPAGTLNDVTVINVDGSFGTASNAWFADFLDVPQGDLFHDFVERIFRKGITAGYGTGLYGRDDPVTRNVMAVFLLKSKHGSSYTPPTCSGIFPDVPCPSPFADWIEQLSAEGITAGCGGGLYCPDSPVTRRQMAVFLLKTKEGSGYTPLPATGIFGDVPKADTFAPWIEDLYSRQITGGCQVSPLLYCPGNPNTRGQMAVFLVKTFGL